jgi:hypothetical protein
MMGSRDNPRRGEEGGKEKGKERCTINSWPRLIRDLNIVLRSSGASIIKA